MLELVLGIIIGLLVNPFRKEVLEITQKSIKGIKPESTQFVEPINKKEKWLKAESLSEILDD